MKTVLSLAAFAFAGLFAVIIRADGWSSPILPCHLPGGTTTLAFDVLPTPIKTDILGAYSDMAPRDAEFQETDVLDSNHPLPCCRFIQAGHSGGRWYVWYERAGIAHEFISIIDELRPDGTLRGRVAHLSAAPQKLCIETLNRWKDPVQE